MDVAVHMGTLGAVVVYFHKEVFSLLKNLPRFFRGDFETRESKETLCLIIGTLPAVGLGFILSKVGLSCFYSFGVIGTTSIVYGLLLYVADQKSLARRSSEDISYKEALWIGCAQALALIPGTSRSGVCITMCRYLRLTRVEAVKFSFLLSIPSVIAATTLTTYQALQQHPPGDFLQDAALGIFFSLSAGLGAIHFMMAWVKKFSFTPFVIYRVGLGLFLVLYSL